MSSRKYTQKEVEETLLTLYKNRGNIVKTSDETGIPITDIGRFKKSAIEALDILRIKRAKDFISLGHELVVDILKSDYLKTTLEEASLKDLTDFIVKIVATLETYQESLGIAGIDVGEIKGEITDGINKRPAEEVTSLKLIEAPKKKPKAVESVGADPSEYLDGE